MGGDLVAHHQAADRVGLGQAGGDQNHTLGSQDVPHAHGDGGGGHVFLALKEAGVGIDGALGQLLDMSGGMQGIAGLVESDMAVIADAQQLQVGHAALVDLGFQLSGVGFGIAHALGHVGVGLVDVDVVEQVGIHEVAIALVMGAGDAAVLIQVHGVHSGEVHLAGLVGFDELLVHGHRGTTGGQAQLAGGLLIHELADHIGHVRAAGVVALGHNYLNHD